jgi:hypothetical protein
VVVVPLPLIVKVLFNLFNLLLHLRIRHAGGKELLQYSPCTLIRQR